MKWDRCFAPRWAAARHNGKQFLIAVDQGLNALLGLLLGLAGLLYLLPRPAGYWWADESISAHCWRWELAGVRRWPRLLVDSLFFWESGHCRRSFESEQQGQQLPPDERCRL